MPNLSNFQPSGYALSVGALLDISVEATKLQQLNFESQKTIAQGEGNASKGYAYATSSAMSKEADGMTANAIGDIANSGMGLFFSAAGSIYELVQTYKNPYDSKLASVNAFGDEIRDVESGKAADLGVGKNQNIESQVQSVRDQVNDVKTINIEKDKAQDYQRRLRTAYAQPDRSAFDDLKDQVRSRREALDYSKIDYSEKIRQRAQSFQSIGQAAGSVVKSKQEMDQANDKAQQAAIEAAKVSAQYTAQSFKTVFDQTAQNGSGLENSKEMVYKIMAGVAESNKA